MSVINFKNLRDIHFGGNTLMMVRLGSEQIWPKPPTGFTVTDWGRTGMFSGDNAVVNYMVARDGRPHTIPGLTFSELDAYSDAQPTFSILNWGTLKPGDVVTIVYRNMSVMYDSDRTIVLEIDGAATPHRDKPVVVPHTLRLSYSVTSSGLSPAATVSDLLLVRASGPDWDEKTGPNQKLSPDGTVVLQITPKNNPDPFSSETLCLYKIGLTNGVASFVDSVPAGAIKAGTGSAATLYDESFQGVDCYEWPYASSSAVSLNFTFDKKVVKTGDVYGVGVTRLQTLMISNTFLFIHIM